MRDLSVTVLLCGTAFVLGCLMQVERVVTWRVRTTAALYDGVVPFGVLTKGVTGVEFYRYVNPHIDPDLVGFFLTVTDEPPGREAVNGRRLTGVLDGAAIISLETRQNTSSLVEEIVWQCRVLREGR
jgi:hypothetical protein